MDAFQSEFYSPYQDQDDDPFVPDMFKYRRWAEDPRELKMYHSVPNKREVEQIKRYEEDERHVQSSKPFKQITGRTINNDSMIASHVDGKCCGGQHHLFGMTKEHVIILILVIINVIIIAMLVKNTYSNAYSNMFRQPIMKSVRFNDVVYISDEETD
jgi:hypothetical protein